MDRQDARTGCWATASSTLFPESERKAARTLYEDAGAGGVHVIELPSGANGVRARLVEFTSAQSKSGARQFRGSNGPGRGRTRGD